MICSHSCIVPLSKQRRSQDSHGRKSKSIHGNTRANTTAEVNHQVSIVRPVRNTKRQMQDRLYLTASRVMV
jgi:hypothetical protein